MTPSPLTPSELTPSALIMDLCTWWTACHHPNPMIDVGELTMELGSRHAVQPAHKSMINAQDAGGDAGDAQDAGGGAERVAGGGL